MASTLRQRPLRQRARDLEPRRRHLGTPCSATGGLLPSPHWRFHRDAPNQPAGRRRYDFGLGWFTPSAARHTQPPFVEHLGGGAGFFNVMRLYPSLGIGVVVMGNATTYDIDAVAG